MAEQRKKSDSILLRTEGKSRLSPSVCGENPPTAAAMFSLELFPATEWPEENGDAGLFRVRVNDVWHCPTGKYSFLTYSAIGELVAALLNDGELPAEETAPYLPEKAEVRVHSDEDTFHITGHVRVSPYQKRDGRWYVQVWVYGQGAVEFCCNDVTLRRVR